MWYQAKIDKYNRLYDGVIPIIINYRGHIYEKSRLLLEKYLPEINLLDLMSASLHAIVTMNYKSYASLSNKV